MKEKDVPWRSQSKKGTKKQTAMPIRRIGDILRDQATAIRPIAKRSISEIGDVFTFGERRQLETDAETTRTTRRGVGIKRFSWSSSTAEGGHLSHLFPLQRPAAQLLTWKVTSPRDESLQPLPLHRQVVNAKAWGNGEEEEFIRLQSQSHL